MKIKYTIYRNIVFCCQNCGNLISYKTALYGKGLCRACSRIKINGATVKHITFCCRDCGNYICVSSALYGQGRCLNCAKNFYPHPMLGKKHSKKSIQKMSNSHKGQLIGKKNGNYGKKFSKEHRLKLSKSHKGIKLSKETKIKISKALTGIKRSEQFRLNMCGKNSNLYIHGKGAEPYPIEFNDILKEKIRKRDNFQCQSCKITEKTHIKKFNQTLHVHHIDYNKFNCDEDNLITTCNLCNVKANTNRDYWFAYYTYIIQHFVSKND